MTLERTRRANGDSIHTVRRTISARRLGDAPESAVETLRALTAIPGLPDRTTLRPA